MRYHRRGRRPAGGMHQTARAQLGASQPFRGVAAPELAARRQRHPLPLLERCRSALFAERPPLAVRAAERSPDQLCGPRHREGRGYHRSLQRRGARRDEPTNPSRLCAKARPAGTRRSHRAPPGSSHDDTASLRRGFWGGGAADVQIHRFLRHTYGTRCDCIRILCCKSKVN